MSCRLCTSGGNETQDHLERCNFFQTKREGLDLTIRMHKVIFWRQVTRTLKDLYMNNKNNVNNNTHSIVPQKGYILKYTGNRVSQPNPNGQGEAQLVSDREICPRGHEGPRTYAGVAISAWDISVDEMITDHPL